MTFKNALSLAITACIFFACGESKETENAQANWDIYGDSTVVADDAISAAAALDKMEGQDSIDVKISATINECCQKKGCWMNVDAGNERQIFVRFKDYAFFVPMNAAGRTAVMDGMLYTDTLSVEQRRHYAEDKGLSEEEIEAITEPEVSYSFMAKGVLISKS
jgi:hypothetical protein